MPSSESAASARDSAVEREQSAVTLGALVGDSLRKLRREPRVLLVMLLAGVLLTGIEALRRWDPVPGTGFAEVQDGTFSVAFSVMGRILSEGTLQADALAGLSPRWIVWVLGLEGFRLVIATIAFTYAFTTLQDTALTARRLARYGGLLLVLASVGVEADLPFSLGLLLVPLALFALVHFVLLPGLITRGRPILPAIRESLRLSVSHRWTFAGFVLLVGHANHLLASLPVVGVVGSSLVAAVHVGGVVSALDRIGDAGDAN